MKNNKTSGSDGLTKEFYETFWDELKTPLMESVNQAFHTNIWSILQRQAVIKLIEKRDKRYIKNWRPIFLLNVDTKTLSKSISNKLKTALRTLISPQQTAYVKWKNRFIGESGKLISAITEISVCFNITGFLVTMDIEKLLILLTIVFSFPSWKSLVLEKTLLPGYKFY